MDVREVPDDLEAEPWRTARDIIADQGDAAELYVIRFAAKLSERGNVEDTAKLLAILDVMPLLRALDPSAQVAIH